MAKKKAANKKSEKESGVKSRYFSKPLGDVNLFERCLCIEVEFSRPGNEKKIQLSKDEFEEINSKPHAEKKAVDMEMLKFGKQLLDSPELQEILKFDSKVGAYMKSMELKNDQLRGGVHMIPVELVPLVVKELESRQQERETLVNLFMEKYPERVKEAKAKLVQFFDASNYPSDRDMRNKFKMLFFCTEFGVSKKLQTVDATLYAKESEKMKSRMEKMFSEMANNLRSGFKQAVDKFVRIMSNNEDGKRNRVYDSHIENLMMFLETFSAKNICNDDEIEKLVETAKKLVRGKKVDDISHNARTNDDFRDEMCMKFKDISKKLEGMVYEDDSRDVLVI